MNIARALLAVALAVGVVTPGGPVMPGAAAARPAEPPYHATGAPATGAQERDDEAGRSPDGRRLYLTGCSSCHGADGRGVTVDGAVRGPSLLGTGAAGAYYQLATGRMPLASSEVQARRKRPAYDPDEIGALVAYVASLGRGRGPDLPDLDAAGRRSRPRTLNGGELAEGGELFRANCAPCHSASGAGGALSYGRAAPSLAQSEPLVVAAAVRAGPGQMPVFTPEVFDDEEVAGIVAYVQYLRDPDDPGGLPIGRLGPVPEGFVAWFFGVGALLGCLWWIRTRSPARRRPEAP